MRPPSLSRALALAPVLAFAATPALLAAEPLAIRCDPRVEAMSILCRFAGYPEYQAPVLDSHDRAIEEALGDQRGHPAVLRLRELRAKRGFAYAAPLELALALDPVTFEPRAPFSPSLPSRAASALAAEVAGFATDARFRAFLEREASEQEAVGSALREALGETIGLDWYRRQYAVAPSTTMTIVPALLSRSANYGIRIDLPGGGVETFQVLATPGAASAQDLAYPKGATQALVIHELMHPFVNPWVDARKGKLLPPASRLFNEMRDSMKRESYGSPRILLYESLVRAQSIRAARDSGLSDVATRMIREDRAKGFLWTESLATRLAAAPDVPFVAAEDRIALFFNEWGATSRLARERIAAARALAAEEEARRTASGPQILRRVPADGDEAVDPSLGALVLVFDRPMAPGISIFGEPPEITGQPAWSEDGTTLTIPVRLARGAAFALVLGQDGERGFVSRDGEALVPREWRFRARE